MSIVEIELKQNHFKSCRNINSGTILCITEEDSFPEGIESTYCRKLFLRLGFIVAALNIAVSLGDVHGVENR